MNECNCDEFAHRLSCPAIRARPARSWTQLWQFRTPIDPDHGGPTSTAKLWSDNLGGLVLALDDRDGEKVILLPIPSGAADDLAAAIREHRSVG